VVGLEQLTPPLTPPRIQGGELKTSYLWGNRFYIDFWAKKTYTHLSFRVASSIGGARCLHHRGYRFESYATQIYYIITKQRPFFGVGVFSCLGWEDIPLDVPTDAWGFCRNVVIWSRCFGQAEGSPYNFVDIFRGWAFLLFGCGIGQ
jgi:hypothetical protein